MNFRVEFDTKGKDLAIIGSLNEFGSWDKEKFLKLTWNKGNIWSTKLRIPLKNEIEMSYYYVEVENGSIVRWEDNQHKVKIDSSYKGHDILFLDRWLLSSQYDSINDSSAFKIMRNRHTQKVNPSILLPTPSDDKVCFRLNLKHFNLKDNETIYVCGSDETLGNWNLERAVQMTDDSFPNLQATFSIPKSRANSFEYKLVKGPKDNITNDNSQWDVLLNKKVSIEETPEISCVIVDCAPFIGDKNLRAAGVSVPVFSLRSEESLGIGEFSDLKLLVDFSKKVGISMIQTLPVNDTNTTGNWKDNYPYSPLSVSALHPIYVRIQQIDGISNKILNKIKILKPEMDEKFLDYEKTLKVKLELLHEIFLDQKETFFKDRDYTKWFSSNKEWLVPYAVFCALRDKNGTSDYNKWKKYGKVSKEEITQLSNKNSEIYDQVAENYFIQYHASKQLREASEYASSLGVAIKGDLPIGVDLFSCDVWLHRNLFITDFSMGGPPDPFNDIGENWSFPIYNWDEMEKDDYAWWRNRLKVLSNYFHAIRIDHVLGFFRAWSIPREQINSHLGFYIPSIPFSEKEFEEKGIWDFERLSKPYTTMEELKRNFTESKCHSIIGEYLEEVSSERYTFKKQIKAEKELIKRIEKNKEEKQVKEFLLKTFINRVLIEDPQLPKHYHFRVLMQKTSSYQNLDNNWRRQLEELYIDYFDSRQDNMWRTRALKTLPMMQNTTDMLVCAENVGTIPSCTQKVLDQLSILGLRIQRWPKKNDEKLENPLNYSFFNVCSPSIHDSSTIRGWWEEDRLSAKLLGEMIGLEGNLPIECKPEIVEKILALNLKSPAILVIIAIQDFLALDDELCINNPQEERVNIPANPYPSWKYRMPFNMDKLLLREEWLLNISHLIKCSDRE